MSEQPPETFYGKRRLMQNQDATRAGGCEAHYRTGYDDGYERGFREGRAEALSESRERTDRRTRADG